MTSIDMDTAIAEAALLNARHLAAQVRLAQQEVDQLMARRDDEIRGAVRANGIRPTARALGMDPAHVMRIAHREERS